MRFSNLTLFTLLQLPLVITSFSPASPMITSTHNTLSKTQLNVHPPFIIGPMIRKMREEQAKKNAPLVSDEEKAKEAPGLKVGTNVWKWPPVWPYEERLFQPSSEAAAAPGGANPMANMMGGSMPDMSMLQGMAGGGDEAEKKDWKTYWLEEKKEAKTVIDEGAAENLRKHYSYYLKDGMSILELGAAENSYLPSSLTLSRHVGVSLSPALMSQNPSLTETLTVDLNNVVEEEGIDSDDIRNLGSESFDAILMANTIDFLTHPREVFRSAFRLLKPGGIMMVPFTGKTAYDDVFGEAQTTMWGQFNDDQHMWVCGSFFQFSADEGWEGLKGFDISTEEAKTDSGFLGKFTENDKKKKGGMFVTQATKGFRDEVIDEENPGKSFKQKMWILPTLESRDKILVVPRLARSYIQIKDQEKKDKLVEHVELLPGVYESLIRMDQFAFPFNLQAQLAVDLISDPDYNGSNDQVVALKMGLGLRKPSEDFWVPIGELTSAMPAEEKVNLLSFLVPRFGTSPTSHLTSFVTGLKPTYALLREKCPALSEGDVQTLGSELLASEILTGRSTRKDFAIWLNECTEEELLGFLKNRKRIKEDALEEMEKMRAERKKKREEEEALLKKYEEQKEKAKEERTMVFNEKTGKMEEVVKK